MQCFCMQDNVHINTDTINSVSLVWYCLTWPTNETCGKPVWQQSLWLQVCLMTLMSQKFNISPTKIKNYQDQEPNQDVSKVRLKPVLFARTPQPNGFQLWSFSLPAFLCSLFMMKLHYHFNNEVLFCSFFFSRDKIFAYS